MKEKIRKSSESLNFFTELVNFEKDLRDLPLIPEGPMWNLLGGSKSKLEDEESGTGDVSVAGDEVWNIWIGQTIGI